MEIYEQELQKERRRYCKDIYNRQTGKTQANRQRLVGIVVGLVLVIISLIAKHYVR